MEFLLSEYAWAEWLDINGANGGPSTGFARSLTNRRYDAAVHGLFGCTSVVVVSRVGMWISHFWEIPSFRATAENWGHPRTAPDIANFNDHVIHQMQHGGNDIPGLTQFTAAGAEFAAAQRPVCAIVTPRGQAPNSWRYEPEVNAIKDVLNDLFPTSPPVIIDYEPRSDDNSQQTTASGKILFQYDPFQAMVTDPNNRCNVYQQAMFGLWVEDRPDYVLQQYWAAEANQLITDFSTYNPMRKRDGNPACKLPSNLPQASTLAKGEDMKPSIAPEPDETRWITLGTSTVASQISQSTVKESRMGQSSGPKTGISAAPATTSFIAANPSLLPSNTPLPSSKITPTSGGEAPAEPTKDACRKAGGKKGLFPFFFYFAHVLTTLPSALDVEQTPIFHSQIGQLHHPSFLNSQMSTPRCLTDEFSLEDCFDDFDSCCSGLCSEDHGTGSLSCA